MTTVGEQKAPQPRPDASPASAKEESRIGKILKALAFFAVVGGFIFLSESGKLPKPVEDLYKEFKGLIIPRAEHQDPLESQASEKGSRSLWNGLVKISDDQVDAIALKTVAVQAQTDPIKLELTGRTAYNENSLTKIRPRFDALVEGVLAEKGQLVKKGEPLVELFSTELATAKNQFQTNYVQWQHDLRLLNAREKLVKSGAVSEQSYVDSRNDESKSRLGYYTSWENLRVLGVPESDIQPLIADLGELPSSGSILNVAEKAKMALRSPVDGIVIQRDVVPGNLYDNNDVLFIVAPLDQLWVSVNVYERDQAKVALGQRMNIQFPFLKQTFSGTVEYVSSEVSKDSRAIQVRASIPNPDRTLKADMLVRAVLDVPALEGQTLIPRISMVVINGEAYAFVRSPSTEGVENAKLFERRKIDVAQEHSAAVIVHSGLKAGEEVVTGGSLILSQIYEDLQMVASGMPAE